ncbi:hypothetical protein [Heyndrickxia sporothermodurans]|uniref:hypothetical protein n=1 Tax=Heyndrickxia sporothermodurans TaxID=46224 RepID=UPI0035E24619
MDIQKIVDLYYILLGVIAVGSLIIGYLVIKIFKSHKLGFCLILISSIFSLYFLIKWFAGASSEVFIGTIPWIFNMGFAILIYPIYLFLAWILTKKIKIT